MAKTLPTLATNCAAAPVNSVGGAEVVALVDGFGVGVEAGGVTDASAEELADSVVSAGADGDGVADGVGVAEGVSDASPAPSQAAFAAAMTASTY